jgi:NAD-dependent dihydropyrimidine dehydrogenase PreA subunit
MGIRDIIKIDEEKCDGCGLCATGCSEGAIKIIDGKARLVYENFCDGLGACIGKCPQAAITIERRSAEPYIESKKNSETNQKAEHSGGCPGFKEIDFREERSDVAQMNGEETPSELRQWPIQLQLVNPNAQYFKKADLLIAADCAPFAMNNFHGKFLKGRKLIILCPKLDRTTDQYVEKLSELFKNQDLKSVTVAHMEVPCCFGLKRIVEAAIEKAEKQIHIRECIISVKGEALEDAIPV